MRKRLLLVTWFLAGCATAGVAGHLVPPVRAGTTPQKWEYHCVQYWGHPAPADLNAIGAQGWELVANSQNEFCFKRPLS
jgi:hypothetical protein